jgi:hypothetical protein
MKKSILAALSLLLLTSTVLIAQGKVSASRHPNLAAAQKFCNDAIRKVEAAQQANEWDMGGHARKAKALLAEAEGELKEAALAANKK